MTTFQSLISILYVFMELKTKKNRDSSRVQKIGLNIFKCFGAILGTLFMHYFIALFLFAILLDDACFGCLVY